MYLRYKTLVPVVGSQGCYIGNGVLSNNARTSIWALIFLGLEQGPWRAKAL